MIVTDTGASPEAAAVRSQSIEFSDLATAGEARAELLLTATPGWLIDDKPDTPPDITLIITMPLGDDPQFETLLALQLPQARAIAAAIVALADYAERPER